jgi:hypothetical protein
MRTHSPSEHSSQPAQSLGNGTGTSMICSAAICCDAISVKVTELIDRSCNGCRMLCTMTSWDQAARLLALAVLAAERGEFQKAEELTKLAVQCLDRLSGNEPMQHGSNPTRPVGR